LGPIISETVRVKSNLFERRRQGISEVIKENPYQNRTKIKKKIYILGVVPILTHPFSRKRQESYNIFWNTTWREFYKEDKVKKSSSSMVETYKNRKHHPLWHHVISCFVRSGKLYSYAKMVAPITNNSNRNHSSGKP
jgi:hypothetical protein